jgi:hypothetical protein
MILRDLIPAQLCERPPAIDWDELRDADWLSVTGLSGWGERRPGLKAF